MSFLCSQHRSQVSNSPKAALPLWRDLMLQGSKAHQVCNYKDALRYFGSAGEVAALMLEKDSTDTGADNLVDMLVFAYHNLSAALCAQQQTVAAERVLTQLHCKVMSLSLNSDARCQLRLDAVASLKTTLFSLCSHLGQQGKLDVLHSVIEETERVAEQAGRELFH